MHALDKTVLTMSAQTEPGHGFLKHLGAIEKHCTVEQRAVFADLDWPRLRQWEAAVAPHDLVWERHAGRVPRDVLLALLPTFTELFVDVPLTSGTRRLSESAVPIIWCCFARPRAGSPVLARRRGTRAFPPSFANNLLPLRDRGRVGVLPAP